jgi:hypothetical protein
MKYISQAIIVFCMGFNLGAQPFGKAAENFRILKLEYENTLGEKATTFFKYDYKGRLFKAYWILDDKSRSSNNSYEYDSNGWLITAYREFSDGLTSFELFTYDSLGNKIAERFYRSDSVSGFSTFLYQENRITQADFRNHKGWLNGILIYQYGENNLKKSAELMKDGRIVCHINFEYDKYQNLKTEFWDFQGKWNQTFVYHYEKKEVNANYYSSPFLTNKSGYRISKEHYTFNNEVGGPSHYYYDSEGLLFKKVYVRSDSISTTTHYKYDAERKLVSSERDYSDGSVAHFNYTYDEHGNLVLRSYFKGDTLTGFESYLYNSDGDLIKAYFKNVDNWLTGSIFFEVNELGLISNGQFQGENGFNASISFNYNDNGLLTAMNWKFTFGKFQQYIFEYELADLPS